MRHLYVILCLLSLSACGDKKENALPDANSWDIFSDVSDEPSYCDPSTPYDGPDAGDSTLCVECRAYGDPESCSEHPECEWYYCPSRNQYALGCYPNVGNHAAYCIGPCEYWTDQASCNAALRCLWFSDRCRSADTNFAASEPDPPCHERKDATSCNAYSICKSTNCTAYVFACWLKRQSGDEQTSQVCLEQRCENFLNEAACQSREDACEWGDDGWCHSK